MDLLRSPHLVRAYWVCVWAALLVEMLAVAWLQRPWHDGDTALYLELARNLVHGHYDSVTVAGVEPDGLRSPGYPLFLAPFSLLPAAGEVLIVITQLLLYAASILLVLRYLCHTAWQRMTFVAVTAIYVFPIFYVTIISAEAVSIFLMTLLAVLLVRDDRFSRARPVAIGVTIGALALVRPDMLPLTLAVPAIVAIAAWRRGERTWRRILGPAAVIPVCAFAILIPYATWNLATFGKFTPLPVTSTIGKSLDVATWEPFLRFEDISPLTDGYSTPNSIRVGLSASVAAIDHNTAAVVLRRPAADRPYPVRSMEIEKDHELRSAAFARMAAHPGSYIGHILNGFWRLLNTGRYPPRVPAPARYLLETISFGVFALAILGGLRVAARPGESRISPIPGLLLLITLFAHMPLHTEARYTSAVRLFLILYAVAALQYLLARSAAVLRRGTPVAVGGASDRLAS